MIFHRRNRLIIIFISLIFLFSCGQKDRDEIPASSFQILEEIQIPIIGNNEYVGFDGEANELLIRNEEGIFLFDLAKREVRWSLSIAELTYMDDLPQRINLMHDFVLVIGISYLQKFDRNDGSLIHVQKIPTGNQAYFFHYPAFHVSINNQPYFLIEFKPVRSPNDPPVPFLHVTNEDYFKRRYYSLFPDSNEDSVSVTAIGKIAPDANIVSDEDKIPLNGTKYIVVDDTLYYAMVGEPKVWQIPVTLDDPDAVRTFNLALKYPAINYKIPKSQGNNIHDVVRRYNENMNIEGIYYDSRNNLFYVAYSRALFEFEIEMLDSQETSASRQDLGIQTFNLTVLDRSFNTIKEAVIPNIHTVVGVHDNYIYVKGWDEGEDYDIIYKGKMD